MRFSAAAALLFGATMATVETKTSSVETEDSLDIGGLGTMGYTYWHTWEEGEGAAKGAQYYEKWTLELADGEKFAAGSKAQWWWCNQKEKKEGSDLIECNLYMYDEASSSIQYYALWVAPTVPDKVTDSVEPSTVLLQGAEI